jgi:hypothetical protein
VKESMTKFNFEKTIVYEIKTNSEISGKILAMVQTYENEENLEIQKHQ